MINSGKEILKPNIKIGDVFVDTDSHTIFKVTHVELNKHWVIHCVYFESPVTGEQQVS